MFPWEIVHVSRSYGEHSQFVSWGFVRFDCSSESHSNPLSPTGVWSMKLVLRTLSHKIALFTLSLIPVHWKHPQIPYRFSSSVALFTVIEIPFGSFTKKLLVLCIYRQIRKIQLYKWRNLNTQLILEVFVGRLEVFCDLE